MSHSVRNGLMAAAMIVLVLLFQTTGADAQDLTGAWQDENGIVYCIRQVGSMLFWNMNDLPRVHNVFYGIIAVDYVTGHWADLPGGQQTGAGTLTLRIESGDRFVKIDESANYLGSVWTRIDDSRCAGMTTTQRQGGGGGAIDLSGTWDVKWTDPYAYYLTRWEISPQREGVWNITTTLLETNHPFNSRYVGKTESGGILQEEGPGRYQFIREATSTNPANPDYFKQTAQLAFDGQDQFTGEGTHQGSKITHWIRLEGHRVEEP